MYSDLDIAFALISESNDYSRQCYQKLVERSLDNVETISTEHSSPTILDGAHFSVRKSVEPSAPKD